MTVESPYVFMSHSSDDNAVAREIAAMLGSAGVNIWVDFESLNNGWKWSRVLESAITDSFAILVLMSHAARESEWVEREILLAMELRKPIYIVRLDNAPIPLYIIDRHHTDLRRDKEAGLRRLAKDISADMRLKATEWAQVDDDDREQVQAALDEQQMITQDVRVKENRFIEVLSERTQDERLGAIARKLIYWGRTQFDDVEFISKPHIGFRFKLLIDRSYVPVMSIRAYDDGGKIHILLDTMKTHQPYQAKTDQLALKRELKTLLPDGYALDESNTMMPMLPLLALSGIDKLEEFQTMMQSVIVKLTGQNTAGIFNPGLSKMFQATSSLRGIEDDIATGDIPFFDDDFLAQTGLGEGLSDRVVVISHAGKQWTFSMDKMRRKIMFGRRDPKQRFTPDVDLTDYMGAKKGVSRKHMTITYDPDDKVCYIEDLNSSNGTFVNGAKIGPKEVRMIRSNDRIRLGGLSMTVYIE